MRIAVASRAVAPLHGWGGLERAVADVCTALAERGHAVTLITTPPLNQQSDGPALRVDDLLLLPWSALPLRRGGVPDRALHYSRFVRHAARMLGARGETFDAAIGHGAAAAMFVPLHRAGMVRRLVLNPHGMEEFSATGLKRFALAGQRALVRSAARHADAVIALEPGMVAAVRHNLNVPRGRVAVVPNGINVAYVDRLTPPTNRDDGPPVLISVARIEANKGLEVLAAALGKARDHLPADWRWLHIGGGAGREMLEEAVAAAGIARHVALLGRISDAALHARLSTATLFVHPTRYEGSPLVMLEAMTHALPIVASAVGGIPDKVREGENGWLVPPGDADALATAILTALGQPRATLRMMGERGRARVITDFSLDHTVDRLLSLIESLTPDPSPSP